MIRCTLHRWRISAAIDSGAPLPQATLRHVEDCPGCRQFRDTVHMIDVRLPACRPEQLQEEVLAELHQRLDRATPAVQRTVASGPETTGQVRLRGPRRPPAIRVAACIAILLLSFAASIVYVTRRSAPVKNGGYPSQIVQDIFLPEGFRSGSSLPAPSKWSAVLTDPYARELQNLSRQTESAIYFLADCAGVELPEGDLLPVLYEQGRDM